MAMASAAAQQLAQVMHMKLQLDKILSHFSTCMMPPATPACTFFWGVNAFFRQECTAT